MIDIARQVAYWRDGAREDWAVAQDLIAQGRVRHALFFAHLALEKVLKAHVCRHTNDLAPRMHNLIRLAEIGDVRPSQEYADVLAEINAFNLEGRYPDMLMPPPRADSTRIDGLPLGECAFLRRNPSKMPSTDEAKCHQLIRKVL